MVDCNQTLMEFQFPPLLRRQGRQTPKPQPGHVTSMGRESVRLHSSVYIPAPAIASRSHWCSQAAWGQLERAYYLAHTSYYLACASYYLAPATYHLARTRYSKSRVRDSNWRVRDNNWRVRDNNWRVRDNKLHSRDSKLRVWDNKSHSRDSKSGVQDKKKPIHVTSRVPYLS